MLFIILFSLGIIILLLIDRTRDNEKKQKLERWKEEKRQGLELRTNIISEITKEFVAKENIKKSFDFIIKKEFQRFPEVINAMNLEKFDTEFLISRIRNIDAEDDKLFKKYSYLELVLKIHHSNINYSSSMRLAFLENLLYCLLMRSLMLKNIIEPIVNNYLNVLMRKEKYLIIKDDYGDYNFDGWNGEVKNFYESKIKNKLTEFQSENLDKIDIFPSTHQAKEIFLKIHNDEELSDWVVNMIDGLVDDKKDEIADSNIQDEEEDLEYNESMNGEEYEEFIKDVFLKYGAEAYKTKSTGDQGVDVIAEIGQRKIAVQCKHYNFSKIGNDAVQQIYSAKEFFDCDIPVVVTNYEFTKQAKQLAEKLRVYLLHHEDLPEFIDNMTDKY